MADVCYLHSAHGGSICVLLWIMILAFDQLFCHTIQYRSFVLQAWTAVSLCNDPSRTDETVLFDYLYIFTAKKQLMLLAWSFAIHWRFPQCLGWSVDQSEAVLAVLQWGLGQICIHTAKIMCPYVGIRSHCILKVPWVHVLLHPRHQSSWWLVMGSVKMLMAGVNRACVLLLWCCTFNILIILLKLHS